MAKNFYIASVHLFFKRVTHCLHMADDMEPTNLYQGQTFSCRQDFEKYKCLYENEKKKVFVSRSSKKLTTEQKNSGSLNQHYELIYQCKFSGKYIGQSLDIRTSR